MSNTEPATISLRDQFQQLSRIHIETPQGEIAPVVQVKAESGFLTRFCFDRRDRPVEFETYGEPPYAEMLGTAAQAVFSQDLLMSLSQTGFSRLPLYRLFSDTVHTIDNPSTEVSRAEAFLEERRAEVRASHAALLQRATNIAENCIHLRRFIDDNQGQAVEWKRGRDLATFNAEPNGGYHLSFKNADSSEGLEVTFSKEGLPVAYSKGAVHLAEALDFRDPLQSLALDGRCDRYNKTLKQFPEIFNKLLLCLQIGESNIKWSQSLTA